MNKYNPRAFLILTPSWCMHALSHKMVGALLASLSLPWLAASLVCPFLFQPHSFFNFFASSWFLFQTVFSRHQRRILLHLNLTSLQGLHFLNSGRVTHQCQNPFRHHYFRNLSKLPHICIVCTFHLQVLLLQLPAAPAESLGSSGWRLSYISNSSKY